MTGKNDVAVLGVGMHPWGKWGRNFVEYGIAAAEAALDDAGIAWTDVQFVSGADTMRNGYPGYVAGATFAQALGWTGCRVASSYAACASGATAIEAARTRILAGLCDVALVVGADTTPEGLPGPERRRPPRRPRLAALPAARHHQPHLLRALRPAPGRPLRRDRRRLRQGQGQERPARPGQPQRPVPQGGHRRGGARLADGGRPAAPARHLRHVRRRCRGGALLAGVRPQAHGHANPVRVAAISTVTPTLPEHHHRDAELRHRLLRGRGRIPERHVQGESIAHAAYEEAGIGPDELEPGRGLRPVVPPSSSTGTRTSASARPARPRSCSTTATPRSAAASPSTRQRWARLLRRGRARPGHRPGVRGHVAAAGPGVGPPGRGRQGRHHGQPGPVRPRLVGPARPLTRPTFTRLACVDAPWRCIHARQTRVTRGSGSGSR